MIALAPADPIRRVLDAPVTWFGSEMEAVLTSLGITKQTLMLLLAGLLVCLMFLWRARRVRAGDTVPRGLGGMLEAIMLFLRDDVVRPVIGKEGDRYLPFIWTLFFLILMCNLIGLIPGMATATGNISINAGLAITAFVAWHIMGIRQLGLMRYARHLVPPVPVPIWPIMLVVELLGHVIRPFALTVRLFANMLAGHVVLATVLGFTEALTADTVVMGSAVSVASVLGGVGITFLEIFVAFLQAFIFTFLTTIFIGMAVHPEH